MSAAVRTPRPRCHRDPIRSSKQTQPRRQRQTGTAQASASAEVTAGTRQAAPEILSQAAGKYGRMGPQMRHTNGRTHGMRGNGAMESRQESNQTGAQLGTEARDRHRDASRQLSGVAPLCVHRRVTVPPVGWDRAPTAAPLRRDEGWECCRSGDRTTRVHAQVCRCPAEGGPRSFARNVDEAR